MKKWFSLVLVVCLAGLVFAELSVGVDLSDNWVWNLISTGELESRADFRGDDGTTKFFSTVDGEVLTSCQDNAIFYSVGSDVNVLRVIVNELPDSTICSVKAVLSTTEKDLSEVGFVDFENPSAGQNLCVRWTKTGVGSCLLNFDINTRV